MQRDRSTTFLRLFDIIWQTGTILKRGYATRSLHPPLSTLWTEIQETFSLDEVDATVLFNVIIFVFEDLSNICYLYSY